ncbi:MAG: chromosomal replication initiator protein DnaA [Gemmataceae bacterium]
MTIEQTRAARPDSPADFAAAFDQALRERIGQSRHVLWFEKKSTFALRDEVLVVGLPTRHLVEWLAKLFREPIQALAAERLGRPVEVRFEIDPRLFREARAAQEAAKAAPAAAPATVPEKQPTQGTLFDHVEEARARRAAKPPKRRWRHLGEFVTGPCNRVAFAAAQSVVEEPGQGPNPLVLHGPVGTGKTHLLEGLFAGLKKRNPEAQIICVSAEDFTNRFVAAMRFGKQAGFRKQFRSCDVLLLDDLHFLARKRATQEEFLHTFDALLDDGRQVALTCDCHPRLNEEFMPELLDRLLGGAIWGLQPPDADTRLALLRAKSSRDGSAPIPEPVLQFLAENLRGNVRELEGALHSVRHYGKVTGRPPDVPLAREALGDLLRHAVRVVRPADVDAAVCAALRLPPGTLQGRDRAWAVSHPRMLAIYLCRKHTAASYGEVSQHFGGRSHSTAVAAEKKVRAWLEANELLAIGGREWPARELVERIEHVLMK